MPGSVSREDGWRRYETKYLEIQVPGVVLTGKAMRFAVMRQPGETPILLKDTTADITITGAGNDVARVAFDPGDYDALPAGYYSGALWSDTDDAMLWPQPQHSGDLYLGHGLAPVA